MRPQRPCAHPGCNVLVRGVNRCARHAVAYEERRREARVLYWTPRWRALRREFLALHPVCEAQGCANPATTVDHVTPHRGDPVRFWAGPFMAMCSSCHSRKTEARDGGFGHEHHGAASRGA